MSRGKWWLASVIGALAVLLGASIALAAEFDGDYTLTLPGIGEVFLFMVDSDADKTATDAEETVVAVATPDGYEIDDDDPDKVAWKNAAGLEVEVKTDKVEADVDWDAGADATLSLPGGGSITVVFDGEAMTVTTPSGWWAFGSGMDWYVANSADIGTATAIFKVEADEDGVEIKPVSAAGDGFLNDLEEEEEEEVEVENEEEGEGQGRGRGNNPNK